MTDPVVELTNIENRALTLLHDLTENLDFSIPTVDFDDNAFQIPQSLIDALSTPPERLTPSALTERIVDGMGMFDQLMTACKAHLKDEYESNRITGAEYTKAYIACLQFAMQYAVQYLTAKDTAYYSALAAMSEAIGKNIQAYTAKMTLALTQAQAHNTKAQYANTVLGLTGTEAQTEQIHAQYSDNLYDEQTPVAGKIGMENKVHQEQINSYIKDALQKAVNLYVNTWTTEKTVDVGALVPDSLNNTAISDAVDKLRALSIDGAVIGTPVETEETP